MRSLAAGLLITVLGVAGCAGSASVEDSPEARRGLADELTAIARDAGGYEQMLDEGAAAAEAATADALAFELGREPTDAELATVRATMRGVLAEFVTEPIWAERVSEVATQHFTAGELAAIRDFYASPAGMRLLEREAAVAAGVEAAIDAVLEERLDAFIDRANAELAAALPELLAEALQ